MNGKTAEEIYEERLEAAVRHLMSQFFDNDLDWMTVVESLEEIGEDERDLQRDAYDLANDRINEIFEKYLEDK